MLEAKEFSLIITSASCFSKNQSEVTAREQQYEGMNFKMVNWSIDQIQIILGTSGVDLEHHFGGENSEI